jgi:acylphosphatase
LTGIIRQVTIRGRVQGVGFRAWVEVQASARNLEGWVRNRRDGSVEALFAGAREGVEDMVALCKSGPISARVEVVTEADASADELNLRGGQRFALLPTL